MSDDMSTDKKEPEGSDDSMDSTKVEALERLQVLVATKKRKGGRKPINATSEERKQRNRQAQSAFRERRTEHVKQLEKTIRVQAVYLRNLQNQQIAADECIMLRYKNSLLERMLLEKGIDVQIELEAKTNCPKVGLVHVPRDMSSTRASRSPSSIVPKTEPKASPRSPKSHPTSSFPVGSTHTHSKEHYKQLEREYETSNDMVYDEDVLQSGPGPYPGILHLSQTCISQYQPLDPQSQVQRLEDSSNGHSSMTQLLDPLESMLGIDPFSLSTSMKFPTSFPVSTSSMR